jgi:hypothetical protein
MEEDVERRKEKKRKRKEIKRCQTWSNWSDLKCKFKGKEGKVIQMHEIRKMVK